MDYFFADPSEPRLPPDEVTIRSLQADLWPDKRRLRVYLEVDLSQKRPSAELKVYDPQSKLVAEADVIESMSRKMEMNLHLRGDLQPGEYTLEAVVFFVDLPDPEDPHLEPDSIERKVVDTKKQIFVLTEE